LAIVGIGSALATVSQASTCRTERRGGGANSNDSKMCHLSFLTLVTLVILWTWLSVLCKTYISHMVGCSCEQTSILPKNNIKIPCIGSFNDNSFLFLPSANMVVNLDLIPLSYLKNEQNLFFLCALHALF